MGKQWAKGNFCDIIPDIFLKVNLKRCCYKHDEDYWLKPYPKWEADKRFKCCVNKMYRNHDRPILAFIVSNVLYFWVVVGGWTKW